MVIAVQTGGASTEIKESRRAKLLLASHHEKTSSKELLGLCDELKICFHEYAMAQEHLSDSMMTYRREET
ncbi:hypothetical protein A8F94_16010 [Bacillus sp. FJAT-27225]|nr:hypothetical protein A8F94_16010 [Bacillus sp. FJAT-27225]